MKKFALAAIFAATALAAAASVPATAAGRDPEPKAPAQTQATPSEPSMEKRYCFAENRTGSRLQRKTCQTRAQWIAETGKDPAQVK